MAKIRIKFKAPGAKFKADSLPKFKHTNGMEVHECYILEAGRCEVDGKDLEYQILKVYLKK